MSFTQLRRQLGKQQLENGGIFAPRLDENGLIPAVTACADTNLVLMVAYMNEESLRLTFDTGYVHYFSRSRQSLWKKGESSGDLQEFVEMRVDCDQDALLVLARQKGSGAACHTGRRSCFYRNVSRKNGVYSVSASDLPPLPDPDGDTR